MPTSPEQFDEMRQRTEAAIARGKVKRVVIDPSTPSEGPLPPPVAKAVDDWRRAKTKRIKQDTKPLMNKLEAEWFAILNAQFPNFPRPRAQAKRYKIANGAWYKPDITVSSWPVKNGPAQEMAFECKGPREMKNIARGILTIKTAAHQWPEVRFVLVWKEKGVWKTQHVLP